MAGKRTKATSMKLTVILFTALLLARFASLQAAENAPGKVIVPDTKQSARNGEGSLIA
jgi:hypothetical protein